MTGARPLLEKRVILYIDKKRKSLVSISRDLLARLGIALKGEDDVKSYFSWSSNFVGH